jgi:hypothetical protein
VQPGLAEQVHGRLGRPAEHVRHQGEAERAVAVPVDRHLQRHRATGADASTP